MHLAGVANLYTAQGIFSGEIKFLSTEAKSHAKLVSKINNTAKSRKGKMLVSTIILAAKEKKPPDKPANKQLNHTESTTATLEDKDHVEEQD